MTAITNKLVPFMKNRITGVKTLKNEWNWEETKTVMNAYGIRLILLTCLSPFLTIIPALLFKLAAGSFSVIGFLLSFVLLIPWLLVPTLFIQHITSHTKNGKIISYVYLGLLLVTFVLWTNFLQI